MASAAVATRTPGMDMEVDGGGAAKVRGEGGEGEREGGQEGGRPWAAR